MCLPFVRNLSSWPDFMMWFRWNAAGRAACYRINCIQLWGLGLIDTQPRVRGERVCRLLCWARGSGASRDHFHFFQTFSLALSEPAHQATLLLFPLFKGDGSSAPGDGKQPQVTDLIMDHAESQTGTCLLWVSFLSGSVALIQRKCLLHSSLQFCSFVPRGLLGSLFIIRVRKMKGLHFFFQGELIPAEKLPSWWTFGAASPPLALGINLFPSIWFHPSWEALDFLEEQGTFVCNFWRPLNYKALGPFLLFFFIGWMTLNCHLKFSNNLHQLWNMHLLQKNTIVKALCYSCE